MEDRAGHRIREAFRSSGEQTDQRTARGASTGGLEAEVPFRSFRVRLWVRFAVRTRRPSTVCRVSGIRAATGTTRYCHGLAGPRASTRGQVQTIHSISLPERSLLRRRSGLSRAPARRWLEYPLFGSEWPSRRNPQFWHSESQNRSWSLSCRHAELARIYGPDQRTSDDRGMLREQQGQGSAIFRLAAKQLVVRHAPGRTARAKHTRGRYAEPFWPQCGPLPIELWPPV